MQMRFQLKTIINCIQCLQIETHEYQNDTWGGPCHGNYRLSSLVEDKTRNVVGV